MKQYNESILRVETGLARQENLEASCNVLFKLIRDKYPGEGYEQAQYQAHIVTDIKGGLYGYGYVWVSDPRIYRILIGKNPDGSERFIEYDDPTWVAPSVESDIKKKESFPILPHSLLQNRQISWAELQDEEDEEIARTTCPKIRKDLPPLFNLPGYKYDEDQKKAAYEKQMAEKEHYGEDTTNIKVPETGGFVARKHGVKFDDDESEQNVLCCSKTPLWVTEEMIRPYFARYNTDKSTYYKKNNKGKSIQYSYPEITFSQLKGQYSNTAKLCVVTFSPHKPFDAVFALLMTRHFYVDNLDDVKDKSGGNKELEVRRGLVIFGHWRKVKRNVETWNSGVNATNGQDNSSRHTTRRY